MIWERSRHVLRLRSALVEFFPAALEAFPDLDAPDALELLARGPDPDAAARVSVAKIEVALKAARRRDAPTKARAFSKSWAPASFARHLPCKRPTRRSSPRS
jgi:hypothetical protein